MPIPSGFEHITRENQSLAPYTWLRLGGPAQFFAEPTTIDELTGLVKRCHQDGVAVHVLGGGSNVLVSDAGVSGMVIHLAAAAFGKIAVAGKRLTAGGGAKLAHVISTAVREGLGGLEHLVGIPGTIGGALHTNAGTHGGDIGQATVSATMLSRSGETVTRGKSDLRFGYRDSSLDELVLLEATFELEQRDAAALTKLMQQTWILKRASQPAGDMGAGCIFKNPGGTSAASLIEAALRDGARCGDAEISPGHANFIVVGPRGKASDVLGLIAQIRAAVAEKMGVELEPAIEIW